MKQALILLNMGGANSIDEVELFLRNMFADKNILPINRYLRSFIGNIIVNKRIDEVKDNFNKYLGGKSPLLDITNQLIKKLETKLDMPIVPIMRYVPPFATSALEKLKSDGIEELILFPMYPQYSTTTTLSSIEDIEARCQEIDYNPKITVIEPYYDDYDYIKLIAKKIIEALDTEDSKEYDLLLSAHGLPMSIIKAGDPYEKQIEANVSALKIYLHERGIEFHDIKLVYQSKVGNSAWLEPNLTDVLRNPTNRKVIIYPLAFTIDNSETIYELDIENREIAQKIKYQDYRVSKCFNDDNEFVDLIVKKIEK
ncbi:MAG TPA: ferrochelatase [Campylobacterales bacterium]|nr:ferrochelatase [Campylobacterales bacterium]HHC11505.1 ferrochelatase [Campylobacterales bacterium]